MSKIIAANFKSNLTRAKVCAYAEGLESLLKSLNVPCKSETCKNASLGEGLQDSAIQPKSHLQVSIFPSATALLDDSFAHFHIGAQNAYFAQSGGFTGEITLKQLEEFRISHLLIGHSERRTLFGESQDFINEKFRFFKEAGFSIYYCIGEFLEVREKGENALKEFLSKQLSGIDTSYSKLVIAYEPIWAIGTGVSASLKQIESTHKMLSQLTDAPLLYGGSVNANNASEILSLPYVNGLLVGSASLELEGFGEIIRAGIKSS